MVDVHTVGAGGGSIAWREGGALRVGPRSAGADPGPACYGRGGERPTVTDANLLLGYLDALRRSRASIDRAAAEQAVGGLAEELGLGLTRRRRASRGWRAPRWPRRSGWSPSSGASIHAA